MRKITKIERTAKKLPKRKRVAAYARVSSDTRRLMHSVSAQVSYYSNLIQKNPDWEYAGVYADCGISGTGTSGRSEFLRMLSDCEAGKIDIILTKSVSRFARNTVDLLKTVRHLKELGIEVRFEKENVNSLSEDGELMLSLLASFAQEESLSISENCKWGIRKRFQSGEIGMANKHILGYRYDEEQKKYVIIPDEAESVRWMFQMYINGVPLHTIADKMNDAGIRTVLGNKFQEGSVRQLIFNEIYAGDILRQKCYMADPLKKTKVKNNGVLPQYYMADCHEAIIDRDTYARVKAEMKRRAAMINPTYCFTGKIRCGICGMPYARKKSQIKGKTYVNWICRSKKEVGMSCTNRNFTEDKLKSISSEILGIEAFDEETFEREVKNIIVLENGNIEFHLVGGGTRKWILPPVPPKPPKVKPEPKRPGNIFDGKIFCGQCGRRYGRAMSDTKDGGHLYWFCRTKTRHGVTCDSVNYPDFELKEIMCSVFGWEEFDDAIVSDTVKRIIIQKTGSIDFALLDGTVKTYKTLKLRNNINDHTSTEAFEGKLHCGECGNLFRRYCCYGKYVYWKCSGKSKVRTECHAKDIADCNLRKIAAYIMDTDEFDDAAFTKQVKDISVLPDGSLEFHFFEGSTRRWQKT